MRYLLFALVFLTLGCTKVKSQAVVGAEDFEVCGYSLLDAFLNLEATDEACKPSFTYCPENKFASPGDIEYFLHKYERSTGFGYITCAPDEMDVCKNAVKDPKESVVSFGQQLDWNEICFSALLAELSYAEEPEVQSKLSSIASDFEYDSTNRGGVPHFFYYDANKDLSAPEEGIYLTFRGTQSVCNIVSDLDIRAESVAMKHGNVNFHSGFYTSGKESADAAIAYIEKLATKYGDDIKDIPIHISGHSLGGAVALIVTWLLEEADYDVSSLYTFGQPQVTDKAGVEYFEKYIQSKTVADESELNYIRIRKGYDIVPYITAAAPTIALKHVGRAILLGVDGTTDDDFTLAFSPLGFKFPTWPLWNWAWLSDHKISESYLDTLNTLICDDGILNRLSNI